MTIEELQLWIHDCIEEVTEEYIKYLNYGDELGHNRFEGFINALTYVEDYLNNAPRDDGAEH